MSGISPMRRPKTRSTFVPFQYTNFDSQRRTKQVAYSGSTLHQSYTVSSSSSQNYRYYSSTDESSPPYDGVHSTASLSPSSPLWHASTSAHA